MAKFKNNGAGPRGINLETGETVWAEAGKTVTVDGKIAKSGVHEDFTEVGDEEELPSLHGKNKAQLIEIAKDEDVDLADDATNAQIIEAIEAKRAA
jgi:hypothetical protein